MTANDYLYGILARESVDTSATSPVWAARDALAPLLTQWGNGYLLAIEPSGSFAKGTANRSGTDVDLFLSLSPATPDTLQDIYDSLFTALQRGGCAPRRQNVSIGLRVHGVNVDVVPGKRQNALLADHSLYRHKARTWTKTNIQTHIAHVRNHGRQFESRLLKLWRAQHGLEFPSFYLELAVIEALRLTLAADLASRVWTGLQYLASRFAQARFVDPANTNNVISDDLTAAEKRAIQTAAARALQARTWQEILA